MGPAGTELRVQACREGRLLPGLATRRQEVRHPGRGCRGQSRRVPGRAGGARPALLSGEHGEAEAGGGERSWDRDQHL